MRVTQRYNKSSFSDKLLTLKEKRTKARVSLNSARWPGGGGRGGSQPPTLMWGGKSQNLINTLPTKALHINFPLFFFFFDYKHGG